MNPADRHFADRHFEYVETNGVRLRTVVEGDGPLVVLLHGWPQCWYLWRHQIDPLVTAGWRVAVPDMRGFGASSCPPEIAAYNIRDLAADVAGLARALGHDDFALVAHDWGCIVGWNTALLHEDSCRAVMGLSVPWWRFGPAAIDPPGCDDRFWYIRYFQQPGVAEAELECDPARSLYTIYHACSGALPAGSFMKQLEAPRTAGLLDVLPAPPAEFPAWMNQADLDYYVEQYRASGFRGGINYYRNIPTNNAATPELEGKRLTQPAAFAAGASDLGLEFDSHWRERLSAACDDLRFIELIDGAGHWLQLEQPALTTRAILRFLQTI